VLTPTMKGAIAETQIAAEAVRLGIVVLRPIVEGRRYDLDAIAAYCADLERCYLLPIEDVGSRSMVHLRLTRAANNQEAAIKYATTYEFAGAIAQLGERVTGSHEVGGSNPPSSTSQRPPPAASSRP
jgi:PD-(D/E)XK endonuclease